MSVSVRRWTAEDLLKVQAGDDWFITLLGNKNFYSKEEADILRSVTHRYKRYIAYWSDEDYIEYVATDDTMLFKLVDLDYHQRPERVVEVISTYREVISL